MLALIDDRLGERLIVPAEPMGDTIEVVVRPADLTAVMRTLREDGIRKVLAGLTSAEEVIHVTMADHD